MSHEKELLRRISVNPKIFAAKPIIRGMRISVEMVLDLLSQGVPTDEILEDFPDLEYDDIRACLVYAKKLVANEHIDEIAIESLA